MGSRGACSGGYSTFKQLVGLRQNMKTQVSFNRGIDVSTKINSKISSLASYKIGDLNKVMSNIKETVIQVDQGSFNKRINQLKNIGFSVVSTTKPGIKKTDPVLAHIRRS